MDFDADVIVIGSGFGGSVCALRAAEAGLRTLVLERGPRVDADLLEGIGSGRAPLFHRRGTPGIAELHLRSGLAALTGSGVGGGSNLYTAVTLPAPAEVFTDAWPVAIRATRLAREYEKVAAAICPAPLERVPARTTVLEDVAPQLGGKFVRLPLAIRECPDASSCSVPPAMAGVRRELAHWLAGGRATRKRTLVETYLAGAINSGATIRPLHEVRRCMPERGGFRVVCRRVAANLTWQEETLSARRVVLAAGTLNTVRLLFSWRDQHGAMARLSPRLGHNFSLNGDYAGLLLAPREPELADCGPPVTGWLDFWASDRLFLMDCGLWPLAAPLAGAGSRPTLAWAIGVMGYDGLSGQLVCNWRGRLAHRFDATAAIPFGQRRLQRLKELAEALKARLLVPPVSLVRRFPITVHPLGGACMAVDAAHGVVDEGGQVFGCDGLFVADGSVLPTATGVAPSMTIAALAERIAVRLVDSCRS